MSIQEAPAESVATSETAEKPLAAPAEGTESSQETQEAEHHEGAEPSGNGNGKVDLSAEVTRLQAQIAAADERHEALIAQLSGQAGAQDEVDPAIAYIEKTWGRTYYDKESGRDVVNPHFEAMVGLAQVLRDGITKEVEAKFAPQLQGVQRSLSGSRFDRALADEGYDLTAQKSDEFRAIVKEMERSPEGRAFKILRDKQPVAAAKWLSAEMTARKVRRDTNVRQRERNGLANQAKGLAGAGQRGAATNVRQFVWDARDPQNLSKAEEYLRTGGTREGIVRKKP